jgi:hypothetical protein
LDKETLGEQISPLMTRTQDSELVLVLGLDLIALQQGWTDGGPLKARQQQ